jgi:hypothetical protein
MRLPRLLTRQLYRAFPELDAYSEEQCRRFMKAAGRGMKAWWHGVLFFVVAVAGLAGAIAGGAAIFGWHDDYLTRLRRDDVMVTIGADLACGLLLPIGPFGALLARDWLLQRRVRWVLRSRASCPACRYGLIGLPLSPESTITCPECGFVAEVDPSLGELTLNEHGVQQYVPSVKMPVRQFWTLKRRRMVLRWAAAVIGIPLVLVLGYEGFIQWQARQARGLIQQLPAQLAAIRAPLAARFATALGSPGESGADVLASVNALTSEFDLEVNQNLPMSSDGMTVYPDLSVLLPRKLTNVADDYQAVAMKLARRIEAGYTGLGVFRRLDDVRACAVLRGPGHSLEDWAYLMNARKFGMHNTLRQITARERKAWDEYAVAFETSWALIRLMRTEATGLADIHAGLIIQAQLIEMRRLLGSGPPAELLDELGAAMERQHIDVPLKVMLETERVNAQLMLATVFAKPANARLGKWGLVEQEGWGKPPGFEQKRLGTLAGNRRALERLYDTAEAEAALPPMSRAALALVQSPTGYLLLDTSFMGVDRLVEWHEALEVDVACARVQLALERFKAAGGKYPATLEELVPTYLKALPLDPMVRGPFGYKRIARDNDGREYLLYSVGLDGVDNGGVGPQADATNSFRGGSPGKPEFFLAKPGEDVVLNAPVPNGP